jgi:hypothetical protein
LQQAEAVAMILDTNLRSQMVWADFILRLELVMVKIVVEVIADLAQVERI